MILVLALFYSILCAPNAAGTSSRLCPGSVKLDIDDAQVAVNLFLGLYTLNIAVPTIWTLQMSRKRRIGVVLVLKLNILVQLIDEIPYNEREA